MKIITIGNLKGDIRRIEFCCSEMVKKIMNGGFYHDCGYIWKNQDVIKFCDSCGKPISIRNIKEK